MPTRCLLLWGGWKDGEAKTKSLRVSSKRRGTKNQEYLKSDKQIGPRSDLTSCLQSLSADDKSFKYFNF